MWALGKVTFPEQTGSEALPYTKISGRSLPCWVSTRDHKGTPILPEQTCSPSLPYSICSFARLWTVLGNSLF